MLCDVRTYPACSRDAFLGTNELSVFLPPAVLALVLPSLVDFGSLVLSPEVAAHIAEAEHNLPYLISHNTFGVRQDRLVTSSGWKALQRIGIRNGIVADGYKKQYGAYSRVTQFVKYQLWAASAVFVSCPSAMTDGAAKLLIAHGAEHPDFTRAAERLTTSNDLEAWTSGQWMTERAGGSDVSRTETVAQWDPDGKDSRLGPWAISGFKWFSSATDADMAVLLAQTEKGLSAFFAPMYVDQSRRESNGVRIQRLKNKLGSKALPTAELELKNTRARLIGQEGKGIKGIATILNVTRIHTSLSAIGFWGRGLAIARAFAKVREVRGEKKLVDLPAHSSTLADQLVTYKAWLLMNYFVVALLGREECQDDPQRHHVEGLIPTNSESASLLLRLLTPVIKAETSKAAIHGLQECMEALGGVGYLENEDPLLNVARLFRDCNVLSIWEGTTNIMAEDVLRAAKGRQASPTKKAFAVWLESSLAPARVDAEMAELADEVKARYSGWQSRVDAQNVETIIPAGREVMHGLGWIVCGALLLVDATQTPADDTARDVARRWVRRGKSETLDAEEMKAKILRDRRLVIGPESQVHFQKALL